MSIVALKNSSSSIGTTDLKSAAAQIGIVIEDKNDFDDYLTLLKSFDVVLSEIRNSPDYIHPSLQPQPLSTSRRFWKLNREGNTLNAWSHRCELRAASPTSDLLRGRTIAIKDNISVGGLPTTLGAPPEVLSTDGEEIPSPIDATVVSRILAAGAVIKGTTTCECFCASPLSFTSSTGPVHNPRLHGYTSGGSSSGSSALIAAHVLSRTHKQSFGETVELAIGSDQAGSVRIPASFNGIYGLKPTFGLIPYTGAAPMSPMIDHIGPLASSIEDIAALLEVMAGYDGIDSRMGPESPLRDNVKCYSQTVVDFRDQMSKDEPRNKRWTVGLLKESFDFVGVTPEVIKLVREAANKFFAAAGVTVKDISIPMHLQGPIIWTASTRPYMSSTLCQGKSSGYLSFPPPHIKAQWPPSQDMFDNMSKLNPALVNIWLSERLADSLSGPEIEAKAHRKVFELRQAYDQALQDVDAIITPCAPTVAIPHPRDSSSESILERLKVAIGITSNTCPFNVTGHPGLSVPCGFSTPPEKPDVQLPVGMQIVGRRWRDEELLQLAVLFEKGKELCFGATDERD